MKKSDRYIKIVESSDEDNCYIGRAPGLMLGGVHGDDEAKVYKQLCDVVEEWIELYENDGDSLPPATAKKDYSVKFNLRVGKELHEQIGNTALWKGQSIHKFCVDFIKKETGLSYPGQQRSAFRH
ncbi:MAG TPA: toxin-antitoxin system HicB family antitoxin [Desulfobacteraceae bacterium]|nr:toxin-antitoxin system HicB family antitoxin [Desulfobacteraceae bacterium]